MLKTSVGRKIVLAVTGLVLVGFLAGHLLGNLKVFFGREALNAYAHHLHSMPGLLWAVRLGLAVCFVVHVLIAVQLKLQGVGARPVPYARPAVLQATLASRTMIWSGLVVLAFVAFHLAHYTWLIVDPSYRSLTDGAGRHDVYGMVVRGFRQGLVSGAYIVAQGLLALHLSHAVSSALQTLGLNAPRYERLIDAIGPTCGVLFFVGYVSIPVAVWAGLVGAPIGGRGT